MTNAEMLKSLHTLKKLTKENIFFVRDGEPMYTQKDRDKLKIINEMIEGLKAGIK